MVQTCCCGCCSLETGTIIIAVLDIISAIMTVINNGHKVNIMVNNPELLPKEQYPGLEEHKAIWISAILGGMIMAIVYGALSVLLLIGARSRNYRKCVPWLHWNYASLGIMALFSLIILIVFLVGGQIEIALMFLVLMAIVFAIVFYFINVVNRYVSELKAE